MNAVFSLALGIGLVTGLRSLAAPAVVAWAAHLGWLDLHGSPLAFIGSTGAVVIFSLLAAGELIGDKLPKTPNRTTLGPLLARILLGSLCGATFCAASHTSLIIGAFLGATGAVIAAFTGYQIRRQLVTNLRMRDLYVASCEDLIALGLACFLVTR